MFIHDAYIDFNGKTYRLGAFKINDQDFSQYPVFELIDPVKNLRVGMLPIYNITSRMCRPLKGVFENPSHISRIIIEVQDNLDLKRILVRSSCTKSKGDMLEII